MPNNSLIIIGLAMRTNTLLPEAKAFADAFGSKVAYVGWAWEEPPSIQAWTGEFIGYLKGGKTVKEAHEKFCNLHRKMDSGDQGYRELKIYGAVDEIIDLAFRNK